MNLHQVAGRHGSYMTQFWRPERSPFANRVAMRKAASKKAVDRRLVLPLDTHNWVRALEVLNAGYARPGRTAGHYQQVIRCIVGQTTMGNPCSCRGSTEAINTLRDKAYALEIPTSQALWVTLTWAYAQLGSAEECLECISQVEKRFAVSVATQRDLAAMVLPLLASQGRYREVEELSKRFLGEGNGKFSSCAPSSPSSSSSARVDADEFGAGRSSSSSSSLSTLSLTDTARMHQSLAEAAALHGEWAKALQHLRLVSSICSSPSSVSTGPTLQSLFVPSSGETEHWSRTDPALSAHVAPAPSSYIHGSHCAPPAADAISQREEGRGGSGGGSTLGGLTVRALRQLLRALDKEEKGALAMECWRELYGDWHRGLKNAEEELRMGRASSSPSSEDLHVFLNCLGASGEWKTVIEVFSALCLCRSADRYLSSTNSIICGKEFDGACNLDSRVAYDTHMATTNSAANRNIVSAGPMSLPLEHSEDAAIVTCAIPLDPILLNLVFSAFPRVDAAVCLKTGSPAVAAVSQESHVVLPHLESPEGVIALFDDLLLTRDDMQLTDFIMASTVGPALYQLGQHERAIKLLQHTPLLASQSARRVSRREGEQEAQVKAGLSSLVYALHARSPSVDVRVATLRHFPFLFPPEVFRHLPPPGELPGHFQALIDAQKSEEEHLERKASAAAAFAVATTDSLSDEERYDTALRTKVPSSLRPGRQHYFPPRSGAELTEAQELAMKTNLAKLLKHRTDAFPGSHAAADADPRPIPKGLHDKANGWNFYGRGGEMVFSNSKRIPHPFSMQPKVMRALADPYRGWNPRKNSSLAHKENVIKWNGQSAV